MSGTPDFIITPDYIAGRIGSYTLSGPPEKDGRRPLIGVYGTLHKAENARNEYVRAHACPNCYGRGYIDYSNGAQSTCEVCKGEISL